MADTAILDLTALTGANAATGDTIELVDVSDTTMHASGTNKRMTLTELGEYLRLAGLAPWSKRLTSAHTIASATATEVTDLEVASLPTGSFYFTYCLKVQAANTGAQAPLFGINFTGTATGCWTARYATSGTTAANGTIDDVSVAGTANLMEGFANRTFSTTSPNTGHNHGLTTANQDCFYVIEGNLEVTVSGNLELWHSSDTAANTTVSVGSGVLVFKLP